MSAELEVSRRKLVLGALLAVASGCGRLQDEVHSRITPEFPGFLPIPAKFEQARLVLQRAAYGPRPGDIARLAALGAGAWIEEQLAEKPVEDPGLEWRVNGLETQQTEKDAPDTLNVLDDGQLLVETEQAALLRGMYSRNQLRETLADFWTNHFNIYAIKNEGRVLIPVDTERALRPHLLGNFREMLFASANSPAMLAYLDNNRNQKGVANENYARELLELHTLGVKSGYSLRDIQEVARCFTGWTVQSGLKAGLYAFETSLHDAGSKYIPFLNLAISPNGGRKDAEQVLERLAVHPKTAQFLAGKLCRNYLGAVPPEILKKASAAYLQNGTSIRAMLRPILLDGLLNPAVPKPVLKRPLEYTLSALRALNADSDGGSGLQQRLTEMGQPLYQWPMPDGFPTRQGAWTGSLLPRWNFALALTSNRIGGTTIPGLTNLGGKVSGEPLDRLLELCFARPAASVELNHMRSMMRSHMADALRSGLSEETALAETAGLMLASPEFQWK